MNFDSVHGWGKGANEGTGVYDEPRSSPVEEAAAMYTTHDPAVL